MLGEYFNTRYNNHDPNTTRFNFTDQLGALKATRRCTVKLMANQLDYDEDKISQVLDAVDLVVYSYRKDYKATVLSLIAADLTNSYAVTDETPIVRS